MQIKNPEDIIKEYKEKFGEEPPEGEETIRVDTEELLTEIEEAIASGIPLSAATPLDPNIDY